MTQIKINTVSDQVWLFMLQYSYTEKMIANQLNISPKTVSTRLHTNEWLRDEMRLLKRLFKRFKLDLIINVSQKIKINWNTRNRQT